MKKPCVWREEEGYWVTSCCNEFVINEGTPKENKMKYCPFCGGALLEIAVQQTNPGDNQSPHAAS